MILRCFVFSWGTVITSCVSLITMTLSYEGHIIRLWFLGHLLYNFPYFGKKNGCLWVHLAVWLSALPAKVLNAYSRWAAYDRSDWRTTFYNLEQVALRREQCDMMPISSTILKPIWGTASTSNIEILERFQSKVLRIIVFAPRYVPNSLIRRDLSCRTVRRNPPLQLSLWWSTLHPSQSSRSKPSLATCQQTPSPVSAYWSAWQILMNVS
jgi:hypothetical protein